VTQDLEKAFAALREEYARALPEKLAELGEALREAQAGNADALARATALAHRLAGTAGAYGLGEVSSQAATLEQALGSADMAGASVAFASLLQRRT
jgi:HPt (histidine-containing phosphotransfer) domain-containing protein